MASAQRLRRWLLRDAATPEALAKFQLDVESAGAVMYDLSLSADGQTIAAGGLDGILRLWSVADGKVIGTFAPPGKAPAAK